MFWHELTSPQIGALNREIPVIIPLGSCEQHGRHLPVITDTLQLEGITQKLEKKLGDKAVITPPLWLGSSHHHLDFPGTLSVPPKLYVEIIQNLTQCFLRHGFRRLFFLNGHGGNVAPLSLALTDLVSTDDRADDASMAFSSWWTLASSAITAEHLGMETPSLTHACEYETSLVIALREDLVKLAEISDTHVEKERPWVAHPAWKKKVEGFHRFHRWTSTGHMGDPFKATKEKGLSLLNAVVDTLAKFITEEFSKWPHMPSLKD